MSATITAVACKSCGGPVPAGFKEFCSRSCFSDHMKKGKADREARYAEFERLWSAAHSAGLAAALAATPPAMVVQRRSDPMDDTSPIEKEWIVPRKIHRSECLTTSASMAASRRTVNQSGG